MVWQLSCIVQSEYSYLWFNSYLTGHHHDSPSFLFDSCLASPPPPPPPPPPLSIRGPVCLQTSLQPDARSAPTGWQQRSGPGPGGTAGSESSCWSTCHLTPPALELWHSTLRWPPLVAVDRETRREEIRVQRANYETETTRWCQPAGGDKIQRTNLLTHRH